jgi:hypothetical protein
MLHPYVACCMLRLYVACCSYAACCVCILHAAFVRVCTLHVVCCSVLHFYAYTRFMSYAPRAARSLAVQLKALLNPTRRALPKNPVSACVCVCVCSIPPIYGRRSIAFRCLAGDRLAGGPEHQGADTARRGTHRLRPPTPALPAACLPSTRGLRLLVGETFGPPAPHYARLRTGRATAAVDAVHRHSRGAHAVLTRCSRGAHAVRTRHSRGAHATLTRHSRGTHAAAVGTS